MYPAGSGQPPTIFNLQSSCGTDGVSLIAFTCNKAISGAPCDIVIVEDATNAEVWSGGLGSNLNAKAFTVSGLANGNYRIIANNGENAAEVAVAVNCTRTYTKLEIEAVTPTNASTATAADATATARLRDAAGAGVETHWGDFLWQAAAEPTPGRYEASTTGLTAGSHTVYGRNAAGQTAQYTFTVAAAPVSGCTNPKASNYNPLATVEDGTCQIAPPAPKPYLSVALMNSLRFVEQVEADGLPSLDNRLFCAEDWPAIARPPYFQKIALADRITTQFRSNYTTHVCEIREALTHQLRQSPPALLKQQNTGIIRRHAAWLAPEPGNAARARLYFNGGQLPLAFAIADQIQVENALPAALNNGYIIQDVSLDGALSIPYLLLNLAFPAGGPTRINVTAVSLADALPYNVYEFTPDWDALGEGLYYAQIRASSPLPGFAEAAYVSEPFALAERHELTNLISYRNYDDAMGLHFTTGLLCSLRVESEFWQRVPAGSRQTMRLPDGKLLKLSAVSQRKIKLNTFKLPPWLHEKLAFAFDMDRVEVNGVEFQAEDGYAEPAYISRYALSNASIVLEQVEPFTDQNGHDLGDINGTSPDFIVTNEKYLKA